jgi:hypothetical protein
MKNLCAKTRPVENPYEEWVGTGGFDGWTWKVLKKWQTPDREKDNPYARWFCWVSSPLCPEGEMGDTYVNDIVTHARMVTGRPDLNVAMRDGKMPMVDAIR